MKIPPIKSYNLVLYASLALSCEMASRHYLAIADKAWKQFGQVTMPMRMLSSGTNKLY